MTRGSIKEYAAEQRERYAKAGKKEKGRLLDEVVAVTGYHRKAAIRLLRGRTSRCKQGKLGRPTVYGPQLAAAAGVLWEAAGRIGARRLQPFTGELLKQLRGFGELGWLGREEEAKLSRASAATLSRLLQRERRRLAGRRPALGGGGANSALKKAIAVRTFADWDNPPPGALEIDLVLHCGESAEGFFLCTLTAVDIASGWVDVGAVWGKGMQRVGAAVHEMRQRLPVALWALDSDNGSEFINHSLYDYCRSEGITFTRSRPFKKNDQAHVEQKNGALVRQLVGYQRFNSQEALVQLKELYSLVRLHANFFQPVQKLVAKSWQQGRQRRLYDQAQTPFQRLCALDALEGQRRRKLEATYAELNPLELWREIEAAAIKLRTLGARPNLVSEQKRAVTLGNPNSEIQRKAG